jgi:hypothetical protein
MIIGSVWSRSYPFGFRARPLITNLLVAGHEPPCRGFAGPAKLSTHSASTPRLFDLAPTAMTSMSRVWIKSRPCSALLGRRSGVVPRTAGWRIECCGWRAVPDPHPDHGPTPGYKVSGVSTLARLDPAPGLVSGWVHHRIPWSAGRPSPTRWHTSPRRERSCRVLRLWRWSRPHRLLPPGPRRCSRSADAGLGPAPVRLRYRSCRSRGLLRTPGPGVDLKGDHPTVTVYGVQRDHRPLRGHPAATVVVDGRAPASGTAVHATTELGSSPHPTTHKGVGGQASGWTARETTAACAGAFWSGPGTARQHDADQQLDLELDGGPSGKLGRGVTWWTSGSGHQAGGRSEPGPVAGSARSSGRP